MDRKEVIRTYFDLMAAAWLMHLRPRLQLDTQGGSSTLNFNITSIGWAFLDANVLALLTMWALLTPAPTSRPKVVFGGAYLIQCAWCCAESTGLNLVELQTVPSMLAADNYFPVHIKMIMFFGLQFLTCIELFKLFFYYVESHKKTENKDEEQEQEQEQELEQEQEQ